MVDFRWHRSTPSPNWRVLPSDERIKVIEGIEEMTIRGDNENESASTSESKTEHGDSLNSERNENGGDDEEI